jgi:hypothetical protein
MSYEFKAGFTRNVQRNFRWLQILLIAAVLGLQGCGPTPVNPNVITGMSFDGRSHRPSDCLDGDSSVRRNCSSEEIESLMFAEIGKQFSVLPVGLGMCALATVDFGDGTRSATFTNQVLDNLSFQALHTYTGWPGKKLIRVKGEAGCYGEVTKEITVGIGPNGREEYTIAFAPSKTDVCVTGKGIPIIRKGSGVRISTNGGEIIYGLPKFNASGDLTATNTPPFFAFPAYRVFSIVYKLGNSPPIQGEVGSVTFKAPETAPLEVCVNDNPGFLGDNAGGMMLTITVNEISAE